MLADDRERFSEFYRAHARSLWAYVYRSTGSATDADDLVQEAFYRVLSQGPGDGDERTWRRYLLTVASHLVVDRWRVQQQRPHDDVDLDEIPAPGAPRRDDRDLRRIYATLPRRDRAFLWLAFVEGLSHREIAEALRVGTSSVRVLLFRAKRRLRALLAARGALR